MVSVMERYSRCVTLFAVLFVAVSVISVLPKSAYGDEMAPPHRLVDGHTAAGLPEGHIGFELKVYAAGEYGTGLISGLQVGVTDRLTIGLSYGGEGVIGYGNDVRWYPLPGIGALIKYRLFNESFALPAIALGFDNQGFGGLADEADFGYDGYIYKSPGFFLAMSKNFIMLEKAQIGFHGLLNYSLDDIENTTSPINFLLGLDIGINNELMFVAEYNFATDDMTDKDGRYYGLPWRGFVNMGLRWAFTPNFHLQFDVRDIFENKLRRAGWIYYYDEDGNRTDNGRWNLVPVGWNRELKVVYTTSF